MSELERKGTAPAQEQREQELQLLQALTEKLSVRSQESLEAREALGADKLESGMHNIPEGPARDQLRQRESFLEEQGLDSDARDIILQQDITRIEAAYLDKRFTLDNGTRPLTESYGKETAKTWIDQMVRDPNFQPQDLERVARFMFDADGLKAVNDLTGAHGKGDEYLRRIAEVLSSHDTQAAKLLFEAGVNEVIPMTAGHGDEFSVMVRGDKPLDMNKLGEALVQYEQHIAEVDVSDLVDFSDQDIRLAYAARTREQFEAMSDQEKAELEASVRTDIPEGFKMHAKASGGVESLAQGILYAMDEQRGDRQLTGQEDYETILNRMMGGLWESADQKMMADKTTSKTRLKESADPHERAQYQIFSRNVDQRMANRELAEARDEIDGLQHEVVNLQADKSAMQKRLDDSEMQRDRRQQLLAEKKKLRSQRAELPRDAYDEAMDRLDDELEQLDSNEA
jgi:GGDEF domain-containing protein